MIIQYQKYDIDCSRIHGLQGKTRCPRCKELGKKNWRDTCLSVNLKDEVLKCHKCGFSGKFGKVDKISKMEYKTPNIGNHTDLSDEHLQYFSKRGITQKTVIRNKIKSSKDWIALPYYEEASVVNVKYRHGKEKKFHQAKEAKPTMYKYNDITGQNQIIICEGEFDALSWEEAGFLNATSVNQGAPNVNDRNIDKKLECISNCFEIFEAAEIIYLSIDDDENGRRLQQELIRMFKPERCKIIDHRGCKDANELFLKEGPNGLINAFKSAKNAKLEGVYECNEFQNEIIDNYRNGQPKGSTTHFYEIDQCWTWRLGEVNLWTGYNNEGKSLMLRQLQLLKSIGDDWKHAMFCPEDIPHQDLVTDLIESFVGKSADKEQDKFNNYMNEMQLKEGLIFMNNHFFMVYPDIDHSIDELLKCFSYTVRKYRIQTITIDPYNQIHHKMQFGEREDLYISKFMTKLKKFALDHNVSVNLVAHQTTPLVQKGINYPEPNLYRIKGGGTFADKADNVLVVWRENRNTDHTDTKVKFISQKIKKQKLTGIPGTVELKFNRRTNRYLGQLGSPIDALKKLPEQKELPIQVEVSEEKDIYDAYNPKNQLRDEDIPF